MSEKQNISQDSQGLDQEAPPPYTPGDFGKTYSSQQQPIPSGKPYTD